MKKIYYPVFAALLLTNCSSAPTASNAEFSAANKSNSANSMIGGANRQPVNLPANQPRSNVETSGGNSNSVNRLMLRDSTVSRKNLENLKSKAGGDLNAEPLPATAATPNPAPDDSEISGTMNEKGVPIETRTFKKNPVLAKVVRTFENAKNPVTKVYLKSGRVLTVPNGAIADPAAATGDDFLRAVGVKP